MTTTVRRTHPAATARPRPLRQRHPRLWALALAVLGTVATAAGGGIGLRHLQKTGLSALTVLGLAVLAAGLVLLVIATRLAWRSLHRWSRLWLVPVLLLVLVALFSGTLAVMFTVVPPTALGSRTPGDLGMTDYREVSLTTSDDVRLSAWLVPPRNDAAVVLLHGAGSNRGAVLPQAKVLAEHGYGVLLLDARGHGRSEGRGMDLGWYGDQDVTAAVSFLVDEVGVDPDRIGLVGLSLGGEQAIGAAGADDRVRAVVAEGATGRTAEDKDGWLPGGLPGWLQRRIDLLTYGLVDVLTPASPPRALHDAVRAADGAEFLLVTAGEKPDEGAAAEQFASAAPDSVDIWTVPGAGHTGGLKAAPADWESRVVGFLDTRLDPGPTR